MRNSMSAINTGILTGLLQKLEQPYTIEDNMLIIEPTSSTMLEILPGEWVDYRFYNLRVDLSTFDAIDWMSGVCVSLAEHINS
jgi:hypothetical protein